MKKLSVAFISKDRIDFSKYLSGQEYYAYTMINTLKEMGFSVKQFAFSEFLDHFEKTQTCPDIIHLYYLDLNSVRRIRKVCRSSKLIYHVYHLEDSSWSTSESLRWRIFLTAVQPFVDRLLVTSRSLLHSFNRSIPLCNIFLVEPYYECACKALLRPEQIIEKHDLRGKELNLLYIGRIHDKRFPVPEVLQAVKRAKNRLDGVKLRLTIVSTADSNMDILQNPPDLDITYVNERLSEKDKCELYSSSHVFLYPAKGNVAINPPITLLESVYHGVLPITTGHVLKDLDVPSELIVPNVAELSDEIVKVSIMDGSSLMRLLLKSFNTYYDKERFIRELRVLNN